MGLRLTGGDVCTSLGAVKATSGNSTAQAPQQAPVLKQIAWKECACEKTAIESLVACVCAAGVILGHRLTGGDVCTALGAAKATSGNSTAQAPQQAPVLKQIAWKECACEKTAIESLVACVCSGGVILGHQLARGAVCIILGTFQRQGGNSRAQASKRALTNKYLAWKECACKRAATASLVACVCDAGVILGHRLTGGDGCTALGAAKATSGNTRAGPPTGPCSQTNSLERMCV